MDPEVTLTEARQLLHEGKPHSALESLSDYALWRIHGGFQPKDGDTRAAALFHSLLQVSRP